jgi:hypothetical protein
MQCSEFGLGGMQLPVLALSSGMWGGKAKGERNETVGWPERNGMKEALLRGLPRLGLTMNGMERKVAKRSVAPEDVMERSGSHLPQALAVTHFMACTLDGWWGFCGYFRRLC